MKKERILSKILNDEKTSIVLIIIGLSSLGASIILFFWANWHISIDSPIDHDKFGQFGGFVGGVVGSIWALAGVILFYIALGEQRKDIKTNQKAFNLQVEALNNQITEFRLQRKELENSRRIYEEQSKTMHIQQFESNFYSLLNVYLNIKNTLNNLDLNKDYFKSRFDQVYLEYKDNGNISEHHKIMVEKYMELYNNNRSNLSHYFKTFYRLIKIIETNISFNDNEKMIYAKILRSQLTDYELLLLYYNSHSILGTKARPLITKYNLLKHIPLFCKPEFKFVYKLQNDLNIIRYTDYLTQFITKHIKSSYEIESDDVNIEENNETLNCITGIYINDEIEIKVYCAIDIKVNGLNLSEIQFRDYLYDLIYDRLILSTYMDPNKVLFSKYITTTEKNTIFGINIKTDSKFDLNEDIN